MFSDRLLLSTLIPITTCFINNCSLSSCISYQSCRIIYILSVQIVIHFIILNQIHLASLPFLRDFRNDRRFLSFNSHQRPRLPGGGRRQHVFPYISVTGRCRRRCWTSSSSASTALTDLCHVRFGFRIKPFDESWEHSCQYHIY
jgi:hypothetical protein